jgi:hypothetical protein
MTSPRPLTILSRVAPPAAWPEDCADEAALLALEAALLAKLLAAEDKGEPVTWLLLLLLGLPALAFGSVVDELLLAAEPMSIGYPAAWQAAAAAASTAHQHQRLKTAGTTRNTDFGGSCQYFRRPRSLLEHRLRICRKYAFVSHCMEKVCLVSLGD